MGFRRLAVRAGLHGGLQIRTPRNRRAVSDKRLRRRTVSQAGLLPSAVFMSVSFDEVERRRHVDSPALRHVGGDLSQEFRKAAGLLHGEIDPLQDHHALRGVLARLRMQFGELGFDALDQIGDVVQFR